MTSPSVHVVSFRQLDYRIQDPLHFAAAFAEAGWRVRSIEVDGVENRFRRFESHKIDRLQLPLGWEGMPLPLQPIRRFMRYVYFLVGAALLRSRYRDGDIVVANDGWSLFLVSLAVPLERTIFYEPEIPNHLGTSAPLFERYLRGFLHRNVRRCAMLITVERHRLRFLSKLYRNSRTMVVLNTARLSDLPTGSRKERPIGQKPRLIYAGRLSSHTLAPLLLDFVAQFHQNYEIEIFGEPQSDCREAYERIRHLSGVTCHGLRPHAVVVEALQRANAAFVLWDPYRRSNFGRPDFGLKYCSPHKFFESVANGIPVICSPNPTLRERLSEYNVGQIIDPLTPEGIEAALSHLFQPDAYAQHRMECARAFAGDWNHETQVKPLIEHIRKMSIFKSPGGDLMCPTTTAMPHRTSQGK